MSYSNLHILVCARQVRMLGDISVTDDGQLSEKGASYQTCEWDKYAIEEAVLLADAHDGEVTVVAVGPERTDQLLREALAVGADNAIHIQDEVLDGVDDITLARVLSAVATDVNPDIILVGVQDEDDATAIVGPALAQLLDQPCATLVVNIERSGDMLVLSRELEGGLQEQLEIDLPAVVTIQSGINEPRYPSLGRIRRAMKQDIRKLSCAELGFSVEQLESSYSRSIVEKRETATVEVSAEILHGQTENIVEQLLERLQEKGFLS